MLKARRIVGKWDRTPSYDILSLFLSHLIIPAGEPWMKPFVSRVQYNSQQSSMVPPTVMNIHSQYTDLDKVSICTEWLLVLAVSACTWLLPTACSCQMPGSNGSVCDEYGGQCPCVTAAEGFASITGRQCNLCPFVNYLTPLGCTGIPSQVDQYIALPTCICWWISIKDGWY